ncbi:MAG: phosphotransferase, partial [Acidimicrobiia bacterium]
MDRYAPLPTVEQLGALGEELGRPARFDRRIVGGFGGTVDVLIVGTDPGERVVLKRYWLPEPNEVSPAESEFRALALAAEHGIPAPSPIWVDRVELFPERAVVISFVEGRVVLDPADPIDWAAQLATVLDSIHGIRTT